MLDAVVDRAFDAVVNHVALGLIQTVAVNEDRPRELADRDDTIGMLHTLPFKLGDLSVGTFTGTIKLRRVNMRDPGLARRFRKLLAAGNVSQSWAWITSKSSPLARSMHRSAYRRVC